MNTLSRQNWSINAQNLAWQRFPQILRNKDNFSNNAADLLSNFFNLSHVVNVARVCRALEWGSLRWGLSLVPLFTLSQTDESLSFNKYFMRISYLFHGDCCSHLKSRCTESYPINAQFLKTKKIFSGIIYFNVSVNMYRSAKSMASCFHHICYTFSLLVII